MNTNERVTSATIIAGGIIIASLVWGTSFYISREPSNILSVTGSARQKITSDMVVWRSNISRIVTAGSLAFGYTQLKRDLEVTLKFLKDNGVTDGQLTISPILTEQQYNGNNNGPTEYALRQTIEVRGTDITKITDLAKRTQAVAEQGVLWQVSSPEYSYSKLAEVRVSLLSNAIADAKDRATRIAESSDQKVGRLKAASIGVVQVLPVGSVEVSDYGAYDTTSIDKEVMVTVKAQFILK